MSATGIDERKLEAFMQKANGCVTISAPRPHQKSAISNNTCSSDSAATPQQIARKAVVRGALANRLPKRGQTIMLQPAPVAELTPTSHCQARQPEQRCVAP